MNLVIIGFMGCGKSTVAAKLAQKIEYQYIDTDALIEQTYNMTIENMFFLHSQEYFRIRETKVLEALDEGKDRMIIATGGGLVLRELNRVLIKHIGKVIYLRANTDTILEHLKDDDERPLLKGTDKKEKVGALMKQRAHIYEKAADIILDVDNKDVDLIVDEILTKVSFK